MDITITKLNIKIDNYPKLTREEYNKLYKNLLNIQNIFGDWCEINVDGLNYKN